MAHATVPVVIDAGSPAAPHAEGALVLEHPHTNTGLDNRKVLMWAFLASDCMFFGTLIATYMVYKNRSLDGPLPRETFDVPYTSVSAFVLLLSSLFACVLSFHNVIARYQFVLVGKGLLPARPRTYYKEYTVKQGTTGDRGPLRIIGGRDGDLYWTSDHYAHFAQIEEDR